MLAALLNKKILIEEGVSASTTLRTSKLTYTDYMETWANVYVRTGRVVYEQSENLLFTTEFTIRSSNKSQAITNKFRIKYKEQYYKIIEIVDTDNGLGIKLICEHYYE